MPPAWTLLINAGILPTLVQEHFSSSLPSLYHLPPFLPFFSPSFPPCPLPYLPSFLFYPFFFSYPSILSNFSISSYPLFPNSSPSFPLLLLSTHSSLIIGGSPLLLSDGGSPPASPASLLAGLLRRRDPSTNPGPIAWWVSVGN